MSKVSLPILIAAAVALFVGVAQPSHEDGEKGAEHPGTVAEHPWDLAEHRGAGAERATVTYARDVAPILFGSCAACHRPEGPAPFSVLSYEEARAMAPAIAAAVRDGRMPPWMPARGRGTFAGERRLSEGEIRILQEWAAAGAPRGDPADKPPVPEVEDGWYLGEPDLVVELPEPYEVPAEGHDFFRHFPIPLPFEGTRWIEAVELRIGDARVVHHAELMVDPTPTSRQIAERDPEPGYDAGHSAGTETMPPGFFLGWTPGLVPARDEAGLAWPLHGGTDLVLQFHLMPRGRPVTLTAEVGIHFADGPPTRVPTILKLTSETIDIPAGEDEYVVVDRHELPVDVDVLGIYPHAHFLAREFRVTASVPGEGERWLLHIPDWDFNWQDAYRYRDPVRLPAGTVITARIRYDNSEANPRNPHDPPRPVAYGPRSTDEMGDVYLRLLPRNQDELPELERDLTVKRLQHRVAGLNHRLSRDPGDTGALRGLGEVYLSIGAFDRAVPHFRRALDHEPEDPNVRYSLAIALQGEGELEEALEHFRELAEAVPDQAAPRQALANTLVLMGREEEAVPHYRRVLEADPGHAGAAGNLAVVLLGLGRTPEGLEIAIRAVESYVAAGDETSAREVLEFALGEARSAGERAAARRLEELRERLGG
jgi:tetratricopeptide (TPR) repeat protein/mono/diheme cytochrome c family protein